ncbi:MAG TPA: hypothetical protein VN660_04345 [Steroidobacteraceae bacterium]|nr:hypothetical protein [Steroidobacteraceae bacterium]
MFKAYRPWVATAAAAALLASFTAPPASAETIVVGDQVTVRQTDVPHPKRGMSMAQVEKHFGEPRERHPTVGTPPITRWDYDKFAVFFEKNLVIDAVVPGATSPIPVTVPAATPATEQAAAQPAAAAPANASAPAAAVSADAHKAGSAPKSDAPLSDVSLHH